MKLPDSAVLKLFCDGQFYGSFQAHLQNSIMDKPAQLSDQDGMQLFGGPVWPHAGNFLVVHSGNFACYQHQGVNLVVGPSHFTATV